MPFKMSTTAWTLVFFMLTACAALAISIYLLVRKDEKVKLITSSYTLSSDDLGKSLIVQPRDVRIIVPRDSINWNGIITIENFADITNTLQIDVTSYITIVEYNTHTTVYETKILIDGQVWNYNNKQGSVDLNNYIADLKFEKRITSINIRTIIADNINF